MAADGRGVGLIGCGNIGLQHLSAWLERPAGFRIVAVADATPARLELGRAAADLPPRDAYLTFEEVLARPDVDVVDLCVPPHLRAGIAVAAARAGKHILAEKPLAARPADALAMVDAAATAGVVLGEVHNYLFQPEIAEAHRLVNDGAVGDVEVVIINYLGITDVPGAAEYSPVWRHDPVRSGGGVLMDMLHVAYLAETFLGGPIERVSAWVHARRARADVEDIAVCRFESASGAAIVNVGWGFGPGGVEISGTAGRISIRYENNGTFAPFAELLVSDRDGTRRADVSPGGPTIPLAVRAFAEAVATGRQPPATGADGLRLVEAVAAAYQSAALGRTVCLPLDRADPVHLEGVTGLRTLDLPSWTPVRRRQMFGVGDPLEVSTPSQ